jgi:hypothetical protein
LGLRLPRPHGFSGGLSGMQSREAEPYRFEQPMELECFSRVRVFPWRPMAQKDGTQSM